MMMNEVGLIPPSVLTSNPELGVIAALLTALTDPEVTKARSAELDKLAKTLAVREAELNRRQSAFREHAHAISNLKA